MTKLVWIDLENSPHVPLYLPIMEEIKRRGYDVTLTLSDAYQTKELADRYGMSYECLGRHRGKNRILKAYGVLARARQLYRFGRRQSPALAVGSSRGLRIAANALRIPHVTLTDYEHGARVPLTRTNKILAPDVIPVESFGNNWKRVCQYPGLKEDVYVPRFEPDPSLLPSLGIGGDEIVVTVRPPASVAHYHNPESDVLFVTAIEHILAHPGTRTVILPRTPGQDEDIRERWSQSFSDRRLIIPDKAVDGLNLLWHSDLAISGGGTMNREAAVLRIPVYSIFRGPLGAVDKHLSDTGRLTLVSTPEALTTSVRVERRTNRQERRTVGNPATLPFIVDAVLSTIGNGTAHPPDETDRSVV